MWPEACKKSLHLFDSTQVCSVCFFTIYSTSKQSLKIKQWSSSPARVYLKTSVIVSTMSTKNTIHCEESHLHLGNNNLPHGDRETKSPDRKCKQFQEAERNSRSKDFTSTQLLIIKHRLGSPRRGVLYPLSSGEWVWYCVQQSP